MHVRKSASVIVNDITSSRRASSCFMAHQGNTILDGHAVDDIIQAIQKSGYRNAPLNTQNSIYSFHHHHHQRLTSVAPTSHKREM